MTYQVATDSPPRYQFEENSGTLYSSQVYNCGPTALTKIAQYYRDRWFGIEAGRSLIRGMGPYNVNGEIVYGAPASMPTNAWQQRDILRARGVSCEVYGIPGVAELRNLVGAGRRPVLLGLNFARVPNSVAGHSFEGWHAITVLASTTVEGKTGFLVNDPNFSPTVAGPRPDWTGGKRFYPDYVMRDALADPEINWAVVPTVPKAPTSTTQLTEAQEMAILANIRSVAGRAFEVKAGTVLRKGPGTSYPFHWKVDRTQDFYLHGFAPNGWAAASRTRTSTGLFFVPPEH